MKSGIVGAAEAVPIGARAGNAALGMTVGRVTAPPDRSAVDHQDRLGGHTHETLLLVVPLLLTMVSLEELLKQLLKVVF